MRQASWIAFLLFTVGLLSYEAALDSSSDSSATQTISAEPRPTQQEGGFAEGGGDIPPHN